MPRNSNGEPFQGDHFAWVVYRRENGVYYADGRSNTPGLGRHSLCTRDRAAALERVRALDRVKAAEQGLVAAPPQAGVEASLPLEEGGQLFLRQGVNPDTKKKSVQRYRAVVDKFVAFARGQGIATWQEVKKVHVADYARWLGEARHGRRRKPYGERTQIFERIVLAQVLKFLAESGRIERVDLRGVRPKKMPPTDAYCYTPEEVEEMIAYCSTRPGLHWILRVIVTLANTAMRIGELEALRWEDVDLAGGWATLRKTKNGRVRRVKLHADVVAVFKSIPRHPDGLVFHGPRGAALCQFTLRRAFVPRVLVPVAKSSTRVSPGFLRGRLHTFRHFSCSWHIAKGLPGPAMQTIMGHQTSGMVMRYVHQLDGAVREHFDRMPSLLPKPPVGEDAAPKPEGAGGSQDSWPKTDASAADAITDVERDDASGRDRPAC